MRKFANFIVRNKSKGLEGSKEPEFSLFEMESDVQKIGGAFPIWIRTEAYTEVFQRINWRDEEKTIEEAEQAAMRLAMEKVPNPRQDH